MDDGVGVTENDEAEIETDEENEDDVVDVNTPVLTEVVEGSMVDVNAPVLTEVVEGSMVDANTPVLTEVVEGSMVDVNTPVLTEVVEGSMVDVNTPVLTEVVAELNAPVVEMVAEGVGVITDDEELPPPKSVKRNSYNQMCLYKGYLP